MLESMLKNSKMRNIKPYKGKDGLVYHLPNNTTLKLFPFDTQSSYRKAVKEASHLAYGFENGLRTPKPLAIISPQELIGITVQYFGVLLETIPQATPVQKLSLCDFARAKDQYDELLTLSQDIGISFHDHSLHENTLYSTSENTLYIFDASDWRIDELDDWEAENAFYSREEEHRACKEVFGPLTSSFLLYSNKTH